MSKFYNILGSVGVDHELIAPGAANDIKSISIANLHDTNDATVSLFIQDDPSSGVTSTYNLISTVAIPADTSLLLDEPSIFRFDEKYGFYITVGSSDTVDVIIST